MYWLYIILFIIAIMIPNMIGDHLLFLEGERAESLALMLLGIITFLIFFLVEKQHTKEIREKAEIQKQASNIFKDLKYSYAYIGEINRKLDIIKNLAVNMPERLKKGKYKNEEAYQHLIQAIKVVGKSDKLVIRFISKKNLETVKELKSGKKTNWRIENNKDWFIDKFVHEADQFTVFCAPKALDDLKACIIIPKRKNQLAEDVEILKIMASYALVLFAAENDGANG